MSMHPYTLRQKMSTAYRKKGKGYKPRTHHFQAGGLPKYTNRLIFETSPYLLQHAHNPVNWYPWGKAAFDRAEREKKPVLLSVGYATCHWCHVMERESFENKKVAAYLNKHYIAIKVDREERTDIDGIYMQVVQMLTGSGGWPMTVWLTPKKQPFYGGTYFPPNNRWRRRGFLSVLKLMRKRFKQHPQTIQSTSTKLLRRLRSYAYVPGASSVPSYHPIHTLVRQYHQRFDDVDGGVRRRIKFPSSLSSQLLYRYDRRTGHPRARYMASFTLQKMARGGLYDQLGGGFHRYATDAKWLVPHFEKMLYDNALLTFSYLDGYQVTKRAEFRRIVEEVLDYVSREMTAPGGGFFSATDADSEGHEGKFFVWTLAQIKKHLPARDAKIFATYYAMTSKGNFEGKNILHIPAAPEKVARQLKITKSALRDVIQKSRKRLYLVRKKRIPPLCDTKIITSWNALMISAYARAALVLGRADYRKKAVAASRFLWKHVQRKGRLFRTWKDGVAKHNAYLEDYAFLIAAYLDVFEVTQDVHWLRAARSLQRTLQRYYWDAKAGGYFRTSADHEKLLVRPKPQYDGAVPTGNSIQVMNLLRLYELTTKPRFRLYAEKTMRAFGRRIKTAPMALSEMLLALDFYHDKPKQIVLIKPKQTASITPFLKVLRRSFVPNRVFVVTTQGARQKQLSALIPLVAQKKARKGRVTAYVCTHGVCELPTADPLVFAKQILTIHKLQAKLLPKRK
ncbi:MAG TPA: thioredoxin domain-containing protein [Myxococcales bacterium]|nr:thioredoxin domain-containing protein [Deltaproteobacteria bacterium]MBU50868.1 thioredoxin domain-containing protein [Deltaproteobacteria bacterium]HAA54930.1 thioredoxin domain-containing protein [Myxococcales bacterium]